MAAIVTLEIEELRLQIRGRPEEGAVSSDRYMFDPEWKRSLEKNIAETLPDDPARMRFREYVELCRRELAAHQQASFRHGKGAGRLDAAREQRDRREDRR